MRLSLRRQKERVGENRKDFSAAVAATVLVACRRRCALCYRLEGKTSEREGQIAHIDRDPTNVNPENAAWLCFKHHSRYDSRSRQAKGHLPEELRIYQAMLNEHMASPDAWADPPVHARIGKTPGVSLELFDRRLPTYLATIDFIRTVLKLNNIELKDLFGFAAATDQALFLFDDKVAEYLSLLYRRGVRLRAIGQLIEVPERRTTELTQEQVDVAQWFSEQFEETRRRLAPFLRVS